jgi:hypothetical protein
MTTLHDLPLELLHQILLHTPISDLCSFARTCREYYAISIQNESLWRAKGLRDFNRATNRKQYYRAYQISQLTDKSWCFRFGAVFYFVRLLAIDPIQMIQLLKYWEEYPIKLARQVMKSELEDWCNELEDLRLQMVHQQVNGIFLEQLLDGPSLRPCDRYFEYVKISSADVERILPRITYRRNPDLYHRVWQLAERISQIMQISEPKSRSEEREQISNLVHELFHQATQVLSTS